MQGNCSFTVFSSIMYTRHTNIYSYLKQAFCLRNVCVPYEKNHVTVAYDGHPECVLLKIKRPGEIV